MSPDDLRRELERLHAATFGWALSCCRWDRAAAEDVLQASYLKLLDGRARYDGRSSLRTFVFGVVARTARETRRRAALRRWVPLASLLLGPGLADGRPDPAAAVARADAAPARAGRPSPYPRARRGWRTRRRRARPGAHTAPAGRTARSRVGALGIAHRFPAAAPG